MFLTCSSHTKNIPIFFFMIKVWRNNFWMLHHGSKSPKRTTVWSIRKILVAALAITLEPQYTEVSLIYIYVHSVLACCFHKCPYDIYRLLNGSQDKGPLKKNVKNAKSTIKTTRLKLGNVSRCGTWAGITVPAPPRQVSKERWILGILWFKTIEGYAVTTLGTLKFLHCNMLFKYIGNSLSCVSVCAKGVPERPRQGFVEHLERSQNTTCTTSLLTAKV